MFPQRYSEGIIQSDRGSGSLPVNLLANGKLFFQ